MESQLKRIKFTWVDVFAAKHYVGNPLVVFQDADELSTSQMQMLAREVGLPESAFVMSPTSPSADYRVRIFTPSTELPHGGHPTIGVAGVIFGRSRQSREACQETLHGLTKVRRESNAFVAQSAGSARLGSIDVGAVGRALRLRRLEQIVRAEKWQGAAPWVAVHLRDAEGVSRLRPSMGLISRLSEATGSEGLYVFAQAREGREPHFHVRAFAPLFGMPEDPATGSGIGILGSYLAAHELLAGARFTCTQGAEMERPSMLEGRFESGRWWFGGRVVRIGGGSFAL